MITVNPAGYYDAVEDSIFLQAGGLVTRWAQDALTQDLYSLKDYVINSYPYWTGKDSLPPGAILDEDGVFRYPNDPPQAPLFKVEYKNEVMYFYPHAMVIFLEDSKVVAYGRMD